MSKFKKILVKMAGGLFALLLFLGTLFFLFRSFDNNENKKISSQQKTFKKEMTHLSDWNKFNALSEFAKAPGSIVRIKLSYGSELLYDQVYKSDEYLFRIPMPDKKNAEFHAIFAGCSYTMGEGLKEEDTFPWIFQSYLKTVNSYNIGFSGGGAGLILRYFELFNLKAAVKEKKGLFIYTFMPNHLDRFLARFNFLTWVDVRQPYYVIEDKKPVYKGLISEQPFYKAFMLLKKNGLEKSAINTQDRNDWSDRELEDFSLAIKAVKDNYLKLFPKGEFVFVIHPLEEFGFKDRVKAMILKQNIKVLDPMEDFLAWRKTAGIEVKDLVIPYDGHPNGKFNEFYSQWLVEKLKTANQDLK